MMKTLLSLRMLLVLTLASLVKTRLKQKQELVINTVEQIIHESNKT